MAASERLLEPRLLVFGALVGLLSSVVPYSLEMVALRTLSPRVFGPRCPSSRLTPTKPELTPLGTQFATLCRIGEG